ncbi:uncharacterized protein LOC122032934 [Zingiber officinale]|uniref:uncharacterized protein LOC122032934 n=1 Tax=Zingiber officinale TaxID=94328 RepID=UPI001C4C2AD0|nr:uncharacterized protein LOC122032934 [Zingiber officinale]
MSMREKAVVDKFVKELKEALDWIMKVRDMQSYIEESRSARSPRGRPLESWNYPGERQYSRFAAEIVRQEARLKMEKVNLEEEKSVLTGTASNQDNLDGALDITVSG